MCHNSDYNKMPFYGKMCCWIIGILLASCVVMFAVPWVILGISRSQPTDRDTLRFTELNDSVYKSKTEDEIREILWENEKYLYSQQESKLADLRQETNNTIEKNNSWLAFWIATLAFLGVLVPIGLNHRFEGKRDEDLNRFKESIQRDVDLKKDQINYQITASRDGEIERNNQFKKFKAEEQELQQNLQLQLSLNSLISIKYNRLIPESPETKITYYNLVKQALNIFETYIQQKFSPQETPFTEEERWFWIHICVQIFEIATAIQLEASGTIRTREINKIEDEIKVLIRTLIRKEYKNKDEIKEELEDINKKLFNFLAPVID